MYEIREYKEKDKNDLINLWVDVPGLIQYTLKFQTFS